jgi:hypothetical protein
MDQLKVGTVRSSQATGGQKEKNHPMKLYNKAMIVIGTPREPSRKGPHAIFDAGVVLLRHNMIDAETINAE